MMQIRCHPMGDYQTNTYLLWDDQAEQCLVIDPGYDAEEILEFAGFFGKKVGAILLTHGHFDHVGAVKPLVKATGCRVYLNPKDTTMPKAVTAGELYFTDEYDEGDEITLFGLTFRVLATPGHTPGSVCLDFGTDLFTGDTLFAGSCGRIDLPGGNVADMRKSLKRLAEFDRSCRIHPGHGIGSTLDQEKCYNPYLKGML